METTAFFEKKINLTPSDFNKLKSKSLDEILLTKAKEILEMKCSEHGFVMSGSVKLISQSMGYFEAARFTGDAIYYVKLEGKVIYPVDGAQVLGEIIRKNKMGIYVNYNDAIRIQVPRDLHIGSKEFDSLKVGQKVLVEIKRSKFSINDAYILASGLYVSSEDVGAKVEEEEEEEEEEVFIPAPVIRKPQIGLKKKDENSEEKEVEELLKNQEEEDDENEELESMRAELETSNSNTNTNSNSNTSNVEYSDIEEDEDEEEEEVDEEDLEAELERLEKEQAAKKK
jgi:hypothetical protein